MVRQTGRGDDEYRIFIFGRTAAVPDSLLWVSWTGR